MSKDKLQTKRHNKKGGFRMLHARVGSRKQRVSATANSSMDIAGDVPSVGIGRALMIILILHVVAIGAIFIGTKKSGPKEAPAVLVDKSENDRAEKLQVKTSELNKGLERRVVKAGDNYTKLAARYDVGIEELRHVNHNTPLSAGLFIYLPPKKVVVAEADSVKTLRQNRERLSELNSSPVSDRPDLGISERVAIDEVPVKAIPVKEPVPVAVLVKPKLNQNVKIVGASASGKTYKVKAGDSIWRIAHNHKVKQDDLLKLNGISDPRKLREGMTLKIPN